MVHYSRPMSVAHGHTQTHAYNRHIHLKTILSLFIINHFKKKILCNLLMVPTYDETMTEDVGCTFR